MGEYRGAYWQHERYRPDDLDAAIDMVDTVLDGEARFSEVRSELGDIYTEKIINGGSPIPKMVNTGPIHVDERNPTELRNHLKQLVADEPGLWEQTVDDMQDVGRSGEQLWMTIKEKTPYGEHIGNAWRSVKDRAPYLDGDDTGERPRPRRRDWVRYGGAGLTLGSTMSYVMFTSAVPAEASAFGVGGGAGIVALNEVQHGRCQARIESFVADYLDTLEETAPDARLEPDAYMARY